MKITAVNLNAWEVAHAYYDANEPPPDGMRMVAVSVSAKYRGKDSSVIDAVAHQYVISKGAETKTTSFDEPTCGLLPGKDLILAEKTAVRTGGVVNATTCFVVDDTGVGTLVLYWGSATTYGEGVWFALSKTTARPFPDFESTANDDVLGERAQALVDEVVRFPFYFETTTAPNGDPVLHGMSITGPLAEFFFNNDPVTSMGFREVQTGGSSDVIGFKALSALLVNHGRADALRWINDEIRTVADTGRMVSDSTALADGVFVTIATEMSGLTMTTTVVLSPD